MKAVRFHGREDIRFEQIPEPECGKGQVKIKPAWCGICGRVCAPFLALQRGWHKERLTQQAVRPTLKSSR